MISAADKLKKMQDTLAKYEAEFLTLRPARGQKPAEPLKLDNLVAEIRRMRLEIDVFLGLPPVGPVAGPIRPVPKFRPKIIGQPRPGQEPRGNAPDWRRGK